MLKFNNVSKIYAKSNLKAVDDVSFHVKPGEIFGFLGPNGAGKTTCINMACGILPISSGSISINNFDISQNPIEAKKSYGLIPDDHLIYDKLTGREYINFVSSIYGIDSQLAKKRTESLLEEFELTNSFDSQISSYSHGMKQKISIISVLVRKPKLWIMDEPMTGLDPQSSFLLKQKMRQHTEEGNSVFFSTHVLEVAEKVCDRVAIINEGKIINIGSLDEIRQSSDQSLEELFLSITNADITKNDNEGNN